MSEQETSWWNTLKSKVDYYFVDPLLDMLPDFDSSTSSGGAAGAAGSTPQATPVPMPGEPGWEYNPNSHSLYPPQQRVRPQVEVVVGDDGIVRDKSESFSQPTQVEEMPDPVYDEPPARPYLSYDSYADSLQQERKKSFVEKVGDKVVETYDKATGDFTATATKPLGPTPIDAVSYLSSDTEKTPQDIAKAWQPILRSAALLYSTYGLGQARKAMRYYAISDALTGHFDRFRTPGEKPRVIEALQPYITMFTLGSISSITEKYEDL